MVKFAKIAATPLVALLEPDRIRQSFSVPFEYEVIFTRDAFAPDNRALVDALSSASPSAGTRCWPSSMRASRPPGPRPPPSCSYFQHHAQHLVLVTDPVNVLAGEAAKNDPAWSAGTALFHQHHMDRHSFVLVVEAEGAGRGGTPPPPPTAGYAPCGCRPPCWPKRFRRRREDGINAFGNKNFIGTFVPPTIITTSASWNASPTATPSPAWPRR